MKHLLILTTVAACISATALISCDSAAPESLSDSVDGITGRGLDLTTILDNPADIPGFPYSLNGGETIVFTPDAAEPMPLGQFTVDTSRVVRQDDQPDPDPIVVYGNAEERSFRYLYTMLTTGDFPEVTSTQLEARITQSTNHDFSDTEFEERMQDMIDSSEGPGSIKAAFDDALAGTITIEDFEIELAKAVSSLGMLCVVHPIHGLVVRQFRTITLSDIDSTNADLVADDPFITGRYELTDIWRTLEPTVEVDELTGVPIEGSFSLPLAPGPSLDISTGAFQLNISALDLTF